MELGKNYAPQGTEDKWYQHWKEQNYFSSTPDNRPAFSIVIPPPNVTGVLHMGHALNNTVQDVLLRYAKMNGYNTVWVPGTDHASIATEAKVVNMLKEQGIDKKNLSRTDFLNHAWQWKDKYGGIILQQLKKLGCALDWDRTHFTMDTEYYQTVIRVFVDLYNKGFIYRGSKIINWDPQALTSLSDEEVIFKETNSKLTYVKYKIQDGSAEEYITIATVRPETIMGDTAICVNPNDPRFAHLKGKHAIVPLINRAIPIIMDEYVDMEFGTGALKITPAHDPNDYSLGKKHNLETINILNADGTLNDAAQIFVGEDRFTARKKVVDALKESGNFVKQDEYKNQVGHSERTNAVVEPRLSIQWWCDMQKLATPALKAVMEEQIRFVPAKFKNLYRHWMENIKDWNISRQLWWGQRIPAWYDEQTGKTYVAENEVAALSQWKTDIGIDKANEILKDNPTPLTQDEDVLDTWFSSWLWPMAVFGWDGSGNTTKDLDYYYPTSILVTGPDIIFFWVARMIMAGLEYKNDIPFNNVYFTGIVRDKLGRKMSKQLGNSPDLLKMIDDHGADVVRFSVLISSPAGNDILFDEAFLDQGRNFINKMWNALKLIKMWEPKQDANIENNVQFALDWMHNKIANTRNELVTLFKDYRLNEALKTIYSLIWNDFCSWYLEWVKPGFEEGINKSVLDATIGFYEDLMQLLHPFMPFVTEEIFHLLKSQTVDLMAKPLPVENEVNQTVLQNGQLLQNIISSIRDARNKNHLKNKDQIQLFIDSKDVAFYNETATLLTKQVMASSLAFTQQPIEGSTALVVDTEKIYLVSENGVSNEAQIETLTKELDYLKGFLVSVDKKLNNERFMSNAKPEIIENEKKKQADAIAKIKVLEESIALL